MREAAQAATAAAQPINVVADAGYLEMERQRRKPGEAKGILPHVLPTGVNSRGDGTCSTARIYLPT